ncbi:Transcription factor, fungi [Penicillium expansum]|uniref:Transcription factor, fungi n=1 Tax=Penicillium expansum TaxID=27334 RepID=A0A0A2J937_PENEN|nr:Transcription factor, fungi [Penicillium expansum]KGO51286.1 Transcription factor, fungi [Penicillium expansum]
MIVGTKRDDVNINHQGPADVISRRTGHRELSRSLSRQPSEGKQENIQLQGETLENQPQEQERDEEQSKLQELRPDASGSPPTPRFVGDLNPEARLLDEHHSPEDVQETNPRKVGVWIQPGPNNKCGNTDNTGFAPTQYSSPKRGLGRLQYPISDLLSDNTIKVLSGFYFANIHPIIPLLDEEEYWQSLSRGTIPMPLVHVVCLLAAKDNGAEKHLKLLQCRDTLVPVRKFCNQLYVSLSTLSRHTMKKTTMMRVLGLLSLHQEGSDGVEEASGCIAQAIHYAQSLALHLPRPNDGDGDLKRTFWCLWTLDRLNAATNSRPCVMADMDIAVSELTPQESGFAAFNVLFRIAQMLNKVIGLYRPKLEEAYSGWDSDFPGFEHIMNEMDAWSLDPSTIATLHLFFLATSILAHRLKTITTLPSPTPARLRQQLSAIQVIRYMQDPIRRDALHPFPIVVYATSLALSVSYQQLRYSRIFSDQEDARQDFNTGCEVLQELRRKWGSADAMAALANRISGAVDQLPCLDILRVHRSDRKKSDSNLAENLASMVDQQPPDLSTDDCSADSQTAMSCLETMNLFAGMDDVSWMYLDAENPVSFDSFPAEFDESYSVW